MREEKLSDAIIYDKLNLLKRDFFDYIERNTVKVDANLPVFYGYVISALENSFPGITDESSDEFIDQITFKVLDASPNSGDYEYIRKVIASALRLKKQKTADTGLNIVVGIKLLKTGDFLHALDYLKDYGMVDTKIGTAVACCYYQLSLKEFKAEDKSTLNNRPGEMELLARETLLTLAGTKPPLNQIRQLEIDNPDFLENMFWEMIFLGLEWFPSEKWFVEIGLENAVKTHNNAMRKRLIVTGADRFYDDIKFLREMYYYNLENKDAGGAAGIVNQLMKQYPDDLEPIYLGLRLSLLLTRKITYSSFRKLARAKRMPSQVIEIFDFSFDLLSNNKTEAFNRITDFEKDYPKYRYYSTLLRYLAHDIFSIDEIRSRRAKKTLLESLDNFCLEELKIKEPA
jgi:hypothetical protein